ncbi:MAG TPA: hypothetical protein P5243_05730 [Bacteroidales bacterium]|jgi:hypothetical protein|nr:hypothetical protein [Bacteroidales bacterium]
MKYIFSIVSLFICFGMYAQTGISTETPNAATVLHIVAPNQNTGVLIPTLTSAQISAIASPTHSLLVYNTTKQKFMYNAGTSGTPLWTFVGDIPAINDISTLTTGEAGDVRYNKANGQIYYWKVGFGWKQLQSIAGP